MHPFGHRDDTVERACGDIARALVAKESVGEEELVEITNSVCERYGLKALPSRSMILASLPTEERTKFQKLLGLKPVRTASGIAVVAVMSRPFPCPHGTCVYCPGGYEVQTPQSYTGQEPAALRGAQNDYDAFDQVSSRLNQLRSIGHKVGKAEIIVMGGTFLAFPTSYQREFVKGCYDAMNEEESRSLEEAKRLAEGARIRNVGITFETRPDFCREEHVDLMLSYGATRVEVGVQTLDDDVYKLVKRGHRVKDVMDAFRVAKDSALKVVAHMMPGLPGSSPDKDLEVFQRLFEDDAFKPDMLKIYPTLVVKPSELYQWYLHGKCQPYDEETTIDLLARIKRIVPRWVRIMRINRDIPSKLIVAGVKKSNLRELVQQELLRRGYRCQCIRCREIGLKQIKEHVKISPDAIRLLRESFESSGGFDVFLSYEDAQNDALIAFLRLRAPSEKAHRPEITSKSCLIRELHVYGPLLPLGLRDEDGWQHRGFGTMLMREAERIAKDEFDAQKMVVMSAVGTREYFMRLGYRLEGPYMVKPLNRI